MESGVSGAVRRRSLRQLAQQLKRRQQWEDSLAVWRELALDVGPEAVEALEELAKHSEHRERDFAGALDYCQDAIARVEEDTRLPLAFRERWGKSLRHRRQRLRRKDRASGRKGKELSRR